MEAVWATIQRLKTRVNWGYGVAVSLALGGLSTFLLFQKLKTSRFYLLVSLELKMLLPILARRITGKVKEVELLQYIVANATEGDPDSVIAAMDEFTRTKMFMIHIGEHKGQILDKALADKQPVIMLEFGAYCGYSAVRIAQNLPKGSRLFSFEFEPLHAAITSQVVQFAGLSDKVKVIMGSVEEKLHVLRDVYGIKAVDAIFIDHAKERYLPDLLLVEKAVLLQQGSVLIADNVIIPGAPDYLEYVRNSGKYESTMHTAQLVESVIDGVEISIYKGETPQTVNN